MTNAAFEPILRPPSIQGATPFVPLNALPEIADIDFDYCLVQATGPITPAWRAQLQAAGAELLEVHPEDAFLVRVPEGDCGEFDPPFSGSRWAGAYLRGYTPSWQLEPIFAGSVPPGVLDLDGSLHLSGVVHRGVDPRDWEASALPGASTCAFELLPSTVPLYVGGDNAARALEIRVLAPVSAACALAAIQQLARLEVVGAIQPSPRAGPFLDDSIWDAQTAVPPVDAADFDRVAKLFANGVTGRGQVVAVFDSGLENDDCHFRYGPNVADTTQFVDVDRFRAPWAATGTGSTNPADTNTNPDPDWRPLNKVVTYYYLAEDPPGPLGPDPPYDDPNGHGTKCAAVACGDRFAVNAAIHGDVTDDPLDDEAATFPTPDEFGERIDHHQHADGLAPGAQLIVQEQNRGGLTVLADIFEQAYGTEPGARVHSNSSGEASGAGDGTPVYPIQSRHVDSQMWRLRDDLIVFAGGNEGPEYGTLALTANCKSCLSVGATKHGDAGGSSPDMMDDPAVGLTSSHGPGFPDRIKPDLCAPGQRLVMPLSLGTPEIGNDNGPPDCEFDTFGESGTSFAAPTVAGLALDLRQYFTDGYYPSGAPDPASIFIPTNALLKATLINSTRNLTGSGTTDVGFGQADRPTYGQGWGKLVVDDTLYFAGDPTFAPAERSRFYVLNDVPNGLATASAINDQRGTILDSFRGAITDGQIHEYSVRASAGEDLHITLAWSDVEGNVGSGGPDDPCPTCPDNTGQAPLRNDLDLEVVAPDDPTTPGLDPLVLRTHPGGSQVTPPQFSAILDPNRLWSGGYSTPFALSASQDCPPGCTACPPGDHEYEHEQPPAPFCDFAGRDSTNTVENVFIRGSDVVEGVYKVRVIGFNVQGNCEDDIIAKPNFVDGDGLPNYDLIDDQHQGYALVVSGKVVTEHGQLLFDQAECKCGDLALLRLEDASIGAGTPMTVTVTTSVGDCDTLPLVGTSPFYQVGPFPIVDLPDPAPTKGCGSALPMGDGIVMVGDDGLITATFRDQPGGGAAPIVVRATARSACRDVTLVSVVVAHPCGSSTSTTTLDLAEEATLTVTLAQVNGTTIQGLWGELLPFDDRVHAGPPSSAVFGIPPDSFAATFRVTVDDAFGVHCYSPLRFRLGLFGENGFRDRVYFDVNESCTVGTVTPPTRPDEIDRLSVRAAKVNGPDTDLELTWAATPSAVTYNVWEGSLRLLHHGIYDHVIPDELGSNPPFCDTGPVPQTVLPRRAMNNSGNHYYLVTAEAPCSVTTGSIDGPWGHPDRNADAVDDIEERPAGRRLDPGCP